MEILVFIILGLLLLYCFLILYFATGWKKLKSFSVSENFNPINVSLVIAFRNEEKNIPALLNHLILQDYPVDNTDIILVNDHSEDRSMELAANFIKKYHHIRVLQLPLNITGKKKALVFGIKNSKHDIILTTDADCFMQQNWVKSMVQYYIKYKPLFLSGPVTFNASPSAFSQMQNLEFLSLVGSGAGSISQQKTIMCNGANLLFQKSLYQNSNIQDKIASGDDIFLMLYTKKISKKDIHFIKCRDAIVYTKPANSFNELINQRVRWASKSKQYKDIDIISSSFLVFLTNVGIIICIILAFFNISFFYLLIFCLGLKSIADLNILIPVSIFFNQKKLLKVFIPLQIIYPFYIVLTAIGGILGIFRWKGRLFNENK